MINSDDEWWHHGCQVIRGALVRAHFLNHGDDDFDDGDDDDDDDDDNDDDDDDDDDGDDDEWWHNGGCWVIRGALVGAHFSDGNVQVHDDENDGGFDVDNQGGTSCSSLQAWLWGFFQFMRIFEDFCGLKGRKWGQP